MTSRGKRTKVTTAQKTRAAKPRKHKLSPNEEKHRYVLENMEEGYYELDLEGNFIVVNPAMCLSMGYDAKELLGRNYRRCVTLESAVKFEETLAKIFSTGNATKIIEYELVQKDGTRRRHEMSASLLRNASGEPVGFFGISRDRTDALRLESALRESEASYYGVMDLCPDTITINEAETGRYVDINKAFTRHTGYSFAEAIGRTPTDLNLFATEQDRRQLGRALRQGSIEGLEFRFRAKDGTLLENLVSGRPIQFKGKQCILFVATAITPLKEAQKALRESEESYRRVLEVAPDAISITRLVDGTYFEINDTFCFQTGYRRDELIGRTALEINIYADPADRKRIVTALRENGRVDGMEIVFRAKDGTLLTDLVSARVMMFKNQECLLVVATLINDLKEAQKALVESERRYRSILEAAPDAICLTRLSDGKYIEANSTFYQRTGFTAEETIGRTSSELNIYATQADRAQLLAALQRDGQVDALEVQVRHKNGTLSYNLWSCRVIQYDNETCLLVVAKEIDELKAAQLQLSESEESYRAILDNAPYSITITRISDARYVLVNEAFCRHTGYSREEALGHSGGELDIYEDPSDRLRFFETYRRHGAVDGMEIRFRGKGGKTTTSLVSARTITFKGEPSVLSITTNIEPLKEIQKALAESEESYRKVIHTTPNAMAVVRRSDLRIIEINAAFSRNFGFSRDESIGRTSLELHLYTDPTDRDHILDTLRQAGQIEGKEVRFRTKTGDIRETLLSVTPLRYRAEECLLLSSVDVTVLKNYQKALRESEENYRRILESAPYSIVVTRLSDTRYQQVNEAFCRRTGFSREEALGHTPYELNIYVDPTARERMLETFRRNGRVDGMEIQFRAKNGRILESLFSVTPIRFHGEDCMLSMTVDISERKRIERELAQYRQHLEAMVQARTQALEEAQNELVKREKLAVLGQLTATVSHELRNPLGVIRSSNFFLQRKISDRDEKVDKHFRRIEEQVALCDAIVADLLEFTRGRMASMVKEDLTPWLIRVIEQLQESQGIPITQDLARPLPVVPHDPEKIRRVVINVLDNAIQAVKAKMPAANDVSSDYRPQILVKSHFADNKVVIEITDNGIGMAPDTLQRAFEPLFTTRARGTGIGLAIVKKVVNEHGGDVSLESTLGEGTRFTFALPCKFQPQGGDD
jgi:PAS domain S-box-containing protein